MHLSPERTLNRIRITGYKPPITETSKNFEQISHIPARLRPPPAKITAPEQENYQTPHHLGSIQDSKTPHPLSRYLGPQKKKSPGERNRSHRALTCMVKLTWSWTPARCCCAAAFTSSIFRRIRSSMALAWSIALAWFRWLGGGEEETCFSVEKDGV
jgi:hypothetical protein